MKRLWLIIISFLFITGCGSENNNKRYQSTLLINDGNELIDSAKIAYITSTLNGDAYNGKSVCFSLQWLYNEEYFLRDYIDRLSGSVLVTYNKNESKYNYRIWFSDGSLIIKDVEGPYYDSSVIREGSSASEDCDGKTGVIKCMVNASGNGECK